MRPQRRRPARRSRALIPGLLGFVGILLLGLGTVPIQGSEPAPGVEVHGFGSLAEDQLNEIRPQKAELVPGEPGDQPVPRATPAAMRQPVPLEAMPVTRAQALSGPVVRSPASLQVSGDGSIQVAVISNLSDSSLVPGLLTLIARDNDLRVYETSLGALDRPDVLLILDSSTTGASVWFCGPSPNESASLASALLPLTRSLGQEPDEAIGDAVNQSLGCTTLHAGRARMAAANLRLPVASTASDSLAALMAEGVDNYLEGAKARILRARESNEVVWPASGPITSHYGPDHTLGIDIGQSSGDIVAATDGTVTFAGGDPCCSYGYYVIIESTSGITTLYGHLDRIEVREGEEVRAGQRLGPVGTTGHSSGVHLHFETLVNGARVNPLSLLP